MTHVEAAARLVEGEGAPSGSRAETCCRRDSVSWRIWLLNLMSRFIFWYCGLTTGNVRDFRRDRWDAMTQSQNTAPSADDRGVASTDFEVPSLSSSGRFPVPVRKYVRLPSGSAHPPQANGSQSGFPLPVLLYFHGGGYCLQSHASAGTHELMVDLVQRLGCVAYSVGYRLAPEHPFPAQLHDGYDVLRFAAMEHSGADITMGGDSAGGNLALVLALLALQGVDPDLRPVESEASDGSGSAPAVLPLASRLRHLALVYPALYEESPAPAVQRRPAFFISGGLKDFFYAAYLGTDPEERRAKLSDWRVAPLRCPRVLLERLPSVSLVIAGSDALCPSNELLAATLMAANREVTRIYFEGAVHGFLTFPRFAVDRQQHTETLDRIEAAVRNAVRGLPPARASPTRRDGGSAGSGTRSKQD